MCRLHKFLYRALPVRKWRALIIKRHFDFCAVCQKEMNINLAIGSLPALPRWIGEEPSYWPKVRRKIAYFEEKARPPLKMRRFPSPRALRLAAGSLMILLLFVSILIYRKALQEKTEPEQLPQSEASTAGKATRIKINYAEIKGKKAISYIYQTPNASFICFTQSKNSGG